MFCRFPTSASLSFGRQAERVDVELISGTYFSALGVVPALGRILTPDDDHVPSGHPFVVLSYNYWRTRFAADPQIVGKTLNLNNYNMTVVGVAQAGFDGVELGRSPKIFIPIMMQAQIIVGNPEDMLKERRNRWVNAFGRLKPGVSQQQAKAALQPFMHSMLEMEVQLPAFSHASAYDRQEFLKCWIDVLPGSQGRSYTRRQLSTPLWVLMATTRAVLLIACANLANLMLVRGSRDRKSTRLNSSHGYISYAVFCLTKLKSSAARARRQRPRRALLHPGGVRRDEGSEDLWEPSPRLVLHEAPPRRRCASAAGRLILS